MTDISELIKATENQSKNLEDRYPWNRFLEAFQFVRTYHATTAKIKNERYPAVTIVFKNTYRAKCFIYWLQKLAIINKYFAHVYLEDEVTDKYKDLHK